ncbi:MAG: FAD-dependent oxidoreductase [Candidatus Omnitrophota bacterium]
MKDKIIIIGAGISGLSAGWNLINNNIKVEIFEAKPFIGGLAASIKEDGYYLDHGPHSLYTYDQEVLDMVLGLFDKKIDPRKRTVKFCYKKSYLDYPLTLKNVLFQMGTFSCIKIAWSFLASKLFFKRPLDPQHKETVEDWAISNFGRHLYEAFFKPYTEQFWKISCKELSPRSLPTHTRMSFINTLKVLLNKNTETMKRSLIEKEMLSTYYPDTGFGEIPEKIADIVEKSGGNIHLNSKVIKISMLPDKKIRVHYVSNDEHKAIGADRVISTIPITELIKIMDPIPTREILDSADKLGFLSLLILGMGTSKQDILNCSYMYQLNRPYNRITELNKFSIHTSPEGKNILLAEMTCLKNSSLWGMDKKELFDICIGALAEQGFLMPGDAERLFLIKIPNAYPIYFKDYKTNLDNIIDYLKEYKNLTTLGRLGEYMYMDADDCIRNSINISNPLIKNVY